MNLTKFLKEVSQAANSMSKEELVQCIYELARTLPEAQRDYFLGKIKNPGKNQPGDLEINMELSETCESLKEKLKCIEDGRFCLNGSLYDEYDEWYDNDEYEYYFEDPDGLVSVIEDACKFVHQCVDSENYQAASEIAMQLVDLEITVEGQYADEMEDTIFVGQLCEQDLSELNYDRFLMDAAYAVYCANALPDRAEAVFHILTSYGGNRVTLEMVMQCGEELPDTEPFIRQWAVFLGEQSSERSHSLLEEALSLAADPQLSLEMARKYHLRHPFLYKQYIENNTGKVPDEKLLEAGKEALEVLDVPLIVRSETALCYSRIALGLGRQQEAEYGWLEAFRSDTSVVNYLRLRVEGKDNSESSRQAAKICQDLQKRKTDHFYLSKTDVCFRENLVSNATANYLMFLEGNFSYVAEHVMNRKEALGWSYTFMKKGLALFLLLLSENTTFGKKGCMQMCLMAAEGAGFTKEAYEKGLLKKTDVCREELFWQCICRWKETISLSEEEQQKYLHWVGQLIEKRVRGIMEGNYRKHYNECAAYIAAFGEVEESKGSPGAAQSVMLNYKYMYARRSAFHRELRAYGMRD